VVGSGRGKEKKSRERERERERRGERREKWKGMSAKKRAPAIKGQRPSGKTNKRQRRAEAKAGRRADG
jgi:hypothetical protein